MNFEVGFKLAVIDSLTENTGILYAKDLYAKCFYAIHNQTGEKCDKELQAFTFVITQLLTNENYEFDQTKCIKTDLGDAHFEAIKMAFGKDYTKKGQKEYTYDFFKEKGLEESDLDFVAYLIAKYSKNPHIVCFWPSVSTIPLQNQKEMEEKLISTHDLIYKRTVKLSWDQYYQLFVFIYEDLFWMDTASEKYRAILNVLYWCYVKGNGSTVVYLINDYDKDLLQKEKEELRLMAGKLYYSVHSTDDRKSTMTALRLLFNQNSLQMLEYFDLTKCPELNTRLQEMRKSVNRWKDDYALDPAMLYRLLKPRDKNIANRLKIKGYDKTSSWKDVFYIYDLRFLAPDFKSLKKAKKPYKAFYRKMRCEKLIQNAKNNLKSIIKKCLRKT